MREQVSETPFFCFPYHCFNISLSCLAACLPVLPFPTPAAPAKVGGGGGGITGTGGLGQGRVFFNIHLRCQTSYFSVQKQQ